MSGLRAGLTVLVAKIELHLDIFGQRSEKCFYEIKWTLPDFTSILRSCQQWYIPFRISDRTLLPELGFGSLGLRARLAMGSDAKFGNTGFSLFPKAFNSNS